MSTPHPSAGVEGPADFATQLVTAPSLWQPEASRGITVLLLDSRTFGARRSFEGKPYWVTVAASPAFTSADKVVGWCAGQFPELTGTALNNQCLATQIYSPA